MPSDQQSRFVTAKWQQSRVMTAKQMLRYGLTRWRKPRQRFEHPVCHDLKSWVSSYSAAEYIVLDPPHRRTRPLPKTVESEIEESFISASSYDVPERALVEIPGARVRGQWGMAVLPNGEFIGELVALTEQGRHSILRGLPAYTDPLPRRPRRRRGAYYMVLGVGVTNYGHFIHEIVMSLSRVVDQLPAEVQLLVPSKMAHFQLESLDLLELRGHKRIPFPEDELWELDTLYVIVPRQSSLIVDTPDHYRRYREAAQRKYGYAGVKRNRRWFLTRKHDRHWRVTNEDEVERVLSRYGFETIAPAMLTFQEQVEKFSQAEIIVGTGSGLMNMVFSPSGAKVLQFQDPSHVIDYFWNMAAVLGIDYHYFLCDVVDNAGQADADLHVPIDKLKASLDQLLS